MERKNNIVRGMTKGEIWTEEDKEWNRKKGRRGNEREGDWGRYIV